MSTKRIILSSSSRLLREMLRRVLDRTGSLQVVQEITNYRDLPSAIEKHAPKWVVVSSSYDHDMRKWMEVCMANYPSVRFLFLTPDRNSIRMKGQASQEDELTNPSLSDFIHILEKDLQHI